MAIKLSRGMTTTLACCKKQGRMVKTGISLYSRVYHYTHIFLMESNRSCASFETPTPLELTSFHLASMFCSILLLTRWRLISGRGGVGFNCGDWERNSRSETCSRLITCTLVPKELSSSGVKRSREIASYHNEVLHFSSMWSCPLALPTFSHACNKS